jgi:hypothetical protein
MSEAGLMPRSPHSEGSAGELLYASLFEEWGLRALVGLINWEITRFARRPRELVRDQIAR